MAGYNADSWDPAKDDKLDAKDIDVVGSMDADISDIHFEEPMAVGADDAEDAEDVRSLWGDGDKENQ